MFCQERKSEKYQKKTIEEQDTEDNMTTLFGLMPIRRRYDTHCYSGRYDFVPDGDIQRHETLKKLDILRLPKKEVQTLDNRIEQAKKQEKTPEEEKNLQIMEEILDQVLTKQN